MQRFLFLTTAALVLTFGSGGTAHALMVEKLADAPSAWATAMAATPDTLNKPGTWVTAPSTRVGSLSGVYRSVFDNTDVGGDNDNAAYIRLSYWAVGPGNATSSSAMTFDGVTQNSLSFLWGSVDTYNTLKFFLGGVLQAEVTDFSFAGNPSGRGAAYVRITDVFFDEVRFGSPTTNAFEFSNLSTTAVPIPAAAWLLGSGLLGLFGLARRRNTAAA